MPPKYSYITPSEIYPYQNSPTNYFEDPKIFSGVSRVQKMEGKKGSLILPFYPSSLQPFYLYPLAAGGNTIDKLSSG
jgi:hypothetical protein